MQSPEELFFHQKRSQIDGQQVNLQDFLIMAKELKEEEKVVTLGQAKDRIVQLT